MTDRLLEGLTVAMIGDARPLRVATRYLEDLGARVLASRATQPGHTDDLWLGGFALLDEAHGAADLALIEQGASPPRTARTIVTYAGTGMLARRPHQALDERALAAVGGVAIALGSRTGRRSPSPMDASMP